MDLVRAAGADTGNYLTSDNTSHLWANTLSPEADWRTLCGKRVGRVLLHSTTITPNCRVCAAAVAPRTIYNDDGEALNLCPGGCGTYVDSLDIDPRCVRCRANAKVADMAAKMGADPDYVAALRRDGWPVR